MPPLKTESNMHCPEQEDLGQKRVKNARSLLANIGKFYNNSSCSDIKVSKKKSTFSFVRLSYLLLAYVISNNTHSFKCLLDLLYSI